MPAGPIGGGQALRATAATGNVAAADNQSRLRETQLVGMQLRIPVRARVLKIQWPNYSPAHLQRRSVPIVRTEGWAARSPRRR